MKYLFFVLAIGMMACEPTEVRLLGNNQVVEVGNDIPNSVSIGDTIILERELFEYNYSNDYVSFAGADTVLQTENYSFMFVKGVVVAP